QVAANLRELTERSDEELAARPAEELAEKYRQLGVRYADKPQAAAFRKAVAGLPPKRLAEQYRALAAKYRAAAAKYREETISNFQKEMKTQQAGNINFFRDVPWEAWWRPLKLWTPLLSLSFIAGIALVLLVHKQWSQRERLRYPLAEMVCELYSGAGDKRFASILHNRRFWLGFLPAFLILLVNGAKAWGQLDLEIPLGYDMRPLLSKNFPKIINISSWEPAFGWPTVMFAAVGFAYLLSSEVSFSLGISHVLFGACWLILMEMGVNTSTDYFAGGIQAHQLFGSYLGMGLMVFYIGRRFYVNVFLNALGIPTAERPESAAVWACRIALLAGTAMVMLLVLVLGLHWLLATLFVMLTGLLFLIVTRINVETGVFFIQPSWQAVGILLGLFGIAAVGPRMLILLAILCAVFTLDPRVCLMPMGANGMRFCEREHIRPARLAPLLTVMIILALVVGTVATLYWQYNEKGTAHGWLSWGGSAPYKLLKTNIEKLRGGPQFHPDQLTQGFTIAKWASDENFLYFAGAGLALVLGCSFLRLRFQWWPIHPAVFVVWGTMPMARLAPSFLVGWVIKGAITKFGGGEAYRKNKPLFIGLIAGALMAGIFWQIAGITYYQILEEAPKRYVIHW
ncbi:MAG TPA: DUF6785 family protein, partial [Phycisphaerae bacterium]|nr:DUF6785 family protein [Phycisphaerae bacterium]